MGLIKAIRGLFKTEEPKEQIPEWLHILYNPESWKDYYLTLYFDRLRVSTTKDDEDFTYSLKIHDKEYDLLDKRKVTRPNVRYAHRFLP